MFRWDTTSVPTGFDYTIIEEASIVLGETDKIDNTYPDGTISVKIIFVGDINRDDTVNITDLNMLVQAFGAIPTSPNWNSNADLNKTTS